MTVSHNAADNAQPYGNDPYDDTHLTMGKALWSVLGGPDGQDWLDALRETPQALETLDDEGWALVPISEVRLVLAALDASDLIQWGGGSTVDKLAKRVGWVPHLGRGPEGSPE